MQIGHVAGQRGAHAQSFLDHIGKLGGVRGSEHDHRHVRVGATVRATGTPTLPTSPFASSWSES